MTWSAAHADATTTATAQKAVLVTGASTGIGRKLTEKLAADGYYVYAGARKEEDLKALSVQSRMCRRCAWTSPARKTSMRQ